MFVTIEKESLNQIALTLTEKSNPELAVNWLFRFINEQSKKEYFCFLTDLSTSPKRYNLFNLYEGTDITLPLGDYTYFVYQKTVLNEDYTTGIECETGKARVYEDETITPIYTNTTTIINVYE
jgi:hypothetical protein